MDISSLYSWPAGLVNPSSLLGSQSSNSSNSSGMFGLIGSGLNAIANIFNQNQINKANMAMQNKQLQFNHDEAALAYQRQRSLIAEQNEYNSFSNQRQLMESAGYNPNSLISGAAGTAVSSGSTSSSPATGSIGNPAVAAKLDLASVFAQLESLKSQTDLNDANAEKARADADATRSNTPTDGKNLGDANYARIVADTENLRNQARLFDRTFDNQVIQSKLLNGLTERQTEFIKAQIDSLYQHTDIDRKTFEFNLENRWPKDIELIEAQTGCTRAQAVAAYASAMQSRAQANYYNVNSAWLDSLYSNPDYYNAFMDKAIGEAQYAMAHADAEIDGLPYVKVLSSGASLSMNVSTKGFGLGGSSSNSYLSNPKGSNSSASSSNSNFVKPNLLPYKYSHATSPTDWFDFVPKSFNEYRAALIAIKRQFPKRGDYNQAVTAVSRAAQVQKWFRESYK